LKSTTGSTEGLASVAAETAGQAMHETEVDAGSDPAQDVIDRNRGIQREAEVQLRLGHLLTSIGGTSGCDVNYDRRRGSPHIQADKFGNRVAGGRDQLELSTAGGITTTWPRFIRLHSVGSNAQSWRCMMTHSGPLPIPSHHFEPN
jgi:hypothetical protein